MHISLIHSNSVQILLQVPLHPQENVPSRMERCWAYVSPNLKAFCRGFWDFPSNQFTRSFAPLVWGEFFLGCGIGLASAARDEGAKKMLFSGPLFAVICGCLSIDRSVTGARKIGKGLMITTVCTVVHIGGFLFIYYPYKKLLTPAYLKS